jgi:hypothetical protein
MNTHIVPYSRLDAFLTKTVNTIVVAALIVGLGFGTVYFYDQTRQYEVAIAELNTQIAVLEKEKMECLHRLDTALIPEASWSEFGYNHVVSPVKNGFHSVKNYVMSFFTNETP